MLNLLRLRALAVPELGLLILRCWLGLTMLIQHGLDKLLHFQEKAAGFMSLPYIGPKASLGLAVFAEVGCSALLVVGFCTRFASLCLAITMGVAFFKVHGGQLTGTNPGELAFLYLAGYSALIFTGAGRWSVDGED